MASIASMIAFLVILFATSSYSAPIVPDLQNATSMTEAENVTIDFRAEDLVILVRHENSTVPQYKRAETTVGLSSSSSEEVSTQETEQTTEKMSTRGSEYTTSSESNMKREVPSEASEEIAETDDKRGVTEDSLSTEVNHAKRAFDGSQWLSADSDDKAPVAKRSLDNSQWLSVDSISAFKKRAFEPVEVSTDVDESSTIEGTSHPSASEVINHKRTFDGSQWLAANPMDQAEKRSVELVESSTDVDETSTSDITHAKRAFDGSQWLSANPMDQAEKRSVELVESSTDVDETSTSEVFNHKRAFDGSQWLSGDPMDQAEKRSVELVESSTDVDGTSTSEITHAKRAFDGSQWLSADQSDSARVAKRSLDNSQWLSVDSVNAFKKRSFEPIEASTDVDESSTVEGTSDPSTSEVIQHERGMNPPSSSLTEASDEFNRRAVGSVESVESGEVSTVIVVKIQPESTTDEQLSSSTVEPDQTTEIIHGKSSSILEADSTVAPVDDSTSASPVSSESTTKILAIIPGRLSQPQVVLQQVQLSQGENQTIVETKKPNY